MNFVIQRERREREERDIETERGKRDRQREMQRMIAQDECNLFENSDEKPYVTLYHGRKQQEFFVGFFSFFS